MRNVNDDSNISIWPLSYGDKPSTTGHFYNALIPRTITDAYDKDTLKQKMLEHEAVFKNQVYELHRVYRRQRDMMELHKHQISIDTSSSSCHLPSHDAQKWRIPSFPLPNSSARSSIFGGEIINSPLSCSKRIDCEAMEFRPSKVRKKLFDLRLPPDDYVDSEGEQTCSYKDGSSDRHFKGSNGLADLNEPVHIEEVVAPLPVDFLRSSARPAASRFGDRSQEVLERSQNGRDSLSCMCEAGDFTSCFKSDKFHIPSPAIQHENGEEHQHSGTHTEIFTRSRNLCHINKTPLPLVTSSTSSSRRFINSSDTTSSWGKPNGSLTSKLTSFQTCSSFLSSCMSHEVFGDKWHTNGYHSPNTGSRCDLPTRNGFCHGSSSGLKELSACLPVVGFDHWNCKKLEGSQKLFKSSDFVDLTDSTGVKDLNKAQTLSSEDDNTIEWLRAKPVICKNNALCDQLLKNGDLGESLANNRKFLGCLIFRNSCISRNDSSSHVSASESVHCAPEKGKRDGGIDINVAWDPTDERIDTRTCDVGKFKNHFDLNLCVTDDEDLLIMQSLKSSDEKVKKMAMEIDLEAPALPEIEEHAPEQNLDHPKQNLDRSEDEERAVVAAGTIVVISGQRDHGGSVAEVVVPSGGDDPLRWFVEVVTRELDEFEVLTLQLEETKEEDYMLKPLGPGFCEPDEAGHASVRTGPRRGHARRGRPRRDFQRDILPGLVSLSRHEVKEDLQIFGGFMKATGHSWSSGSTRRNGNRSGAQGRWKAVEVESPPATIMPPPPPPPPPLPAPPFLEQINKFKLVGLEGQRLTGWGKTTRRPRRQRCAVRSM